MKTALTFSDLEFKPHPHGGFGSHTEINGHILSVQCGARNYCSPRRDLATINEYISFEIAVWESAGERIWCTQKFMPSLNEDVAGWLSREEIEEVITKIKNYTHD